MQLKILIVPAICLGQIFFIAAFDQSEVRFPEDHLPYVSSDIIMAYQENIHGKKSPRWYLINVLPDDICKECSIPGSINIPTHKLQKKLSGLKKWPRDRKIILYCAGGDCPLSKYAYEIVKNHGFADVWILSGGIIGWVQNKLLVQGACALEYLK